MTTSPEHVEALKRTPRAIPQLCKLVGDTSVRRCAARLPARAQEAAARHPSLFIRCMGNRLRRVLAQRRPACAAGRRLRLLLLRCCARPDVARCDGVLAWPRCAVDTLVSRLCLCLCVRARAQSIARRAISALINLSNDAWSLDRMNKAFVVPKLMEGLADATIKHRRLMIMLLNNLTKTPAGSNQLLGVGAGAATADSVLVGIHVRRLMQWFLGKGRHAGEGSAAAAAAARPGAVRADSVNEDGDERDEFEMVASVLHNVTQVPEGQALIVDPERGIIKALLPQLNSPSVIRRRGIAGMLRNCCFVVEDEEKAKFLASRDLGLITAVMFALHGPEDLDEDDAPFVPAEVTRLGGAKVREPDALTRQLLLEALVLLASSRVAREEFRELRVYPILKLCHYQIEGIDWRDDGKDDGAAGRMVGARSAGDDAHGSGLCKEDEAAVEAINKLVDFILREEADGSSGAAGGAGGASGPTVEVLEDGEEDDGADDADEEDDTPLVFQGYGGSGTVTIGGKATAATDSVSAAPPVPPPGVRGAGGVTLGDDDMDEVD